MELVQRRWIHARLHTDFIKSLTLSYDLIKADLMLRKALAT